MNIFIEILIILFIFSALFLLLYFGAFYTMLSDDIEFNCGKKRLKKYNKSDVELWKKALFWDFKSCVIRWHYAIFWIYLIVYPTTILFLVLFIITNNKYYRIVGLIVGIICFITILLALFSRWPLYRGNIIRSRKKYKK